MKDRIVNAIIFGLTMSVPVILLAYAILCQESEFHWKR